MWSCFSHVPLFISLWTVACQASLSMGFFRQEYWSGLPCPPPGYLPNLGIEPMSLMFLPLAPPGKPICGTEGSGETVLFEKFTSSTHPFIASTNIF